MKIKLSLLLFFLCIIIHAVSCTMDTKSKASETDSVALDKSLLTPVYHGSDNSSSVTSSITLPLTGLNGSTISWISDNTSIISNTGIVTRPVYDSGNIIVNLTATITKNTASDTKTFALTVIQMPATDSACVAADKAAVYIVYQGHDNSSSVTSNIILPGTGSCGSTISWSSDNTSVISNTGNVTRPDNGSGNIQVDLIATISKNAVSDTRTFTLTVIEKPSTTGQVNINFESGTLSSLFDSIVTGTGAASAVSSERALDGEYSLKFTSGGAVDNYVVKTFSSQNMIYARVYFRLKSGFTLNEGADGVYNGIRFFALLDSSGNDLVTACINRESTNLFIYGYYYQNGYVENEFKSYGNGTGDTQGVYIYPETTYYFDIYYSYGNGNGTAGLSCNGTAFATVTGLQNNECIPDRVRIGAVSVYGDRATAGAVMYYDDLTVSNSLE